MHPDPYPPAVPGPGRGPWAPVPGPAEAAALIARLRGRARTWALCLMLGLPLSAGGGHYALTRGPAGLAALLVGLALLGTAGFLLASGLPLRRRLAELLPDTRRSAVAHLPGPRRAAGLAAALCGLLVAAFTAAVVLLAVAGLGWGAYGNSFGFAALVFGATVPAMTALAAASATRHALRGAPTGAVQGQVLYTVLALVGLLLLTRRHNGLDARITGAAVVAACALAVVVLHSAARRMRAAGERDGNGPATAPVPPTTSHAPSTPPHGAWPPPPVASAPSARPHSAPALRPPAAPAAPPWPSTPPPWPGAPAVPQWQPPAAPPRRRSGAVLAVLGLVGVLLLGAAATGVVLWQHRHPRGPVTDTRESPQAGRYGIAGTRTPQWSATLASHYDHLDPSLLIGDEIAARVFGPGIEAVALADGTPRWNLPFDGGRVPCPTDPAQDGGIAVVLLRGPAPDAPCDTALAVDLATGRQLWTVALLPDGAPYGPLEPSVAISQGIAVAGTPTAPRAFDARSGRVLWTGPVQRLPDGTERQLDSLTVHDRQVLASYAGDFDQNTDHLLLTHDLGDGHVTTTLPGPHTDQRDPDVRVLAASPALVRLPDADWPSENHYYVLAGDDRTWLPLRTGEVAGRSARQQAGQDGVVSGGVFVKAFTVDDQDLPVGFDTVVAGFDLTTGNIAWQYPLHRDSSQVTLFPGAVDGAVRAVVSAYDTGPQLYAFPLDGGAAVRGGRLDDGRPDAMTDVRRTALAGDRLIVLTAQDNQLRAFTPTLAR
ncbi:putative pyrroloquinoline-quinone binding quinoprotein [Kitasatospora sp. SolWspMP-SS2h]|uniref:outer membrane protein assembly factor BamB family protein n=1 Tax=Kitasatospora sp. SolWspMP-SS2h TaxID=1305729 RepID=UPI000DB9FDEA|nr:PQQ-binding-like beta-propeller repeat protein [Kitasatospora sp. SolWspMP-SS2h]RAJ38333.1 putative pyrroloquinoline-quinone binding quinoprotein [Kitasatospora sp. SolWspMP-SS2h]